MKAETITISNPNPYESKENGTPMISYVVTGSGKEQYRKDQEDKGIVSEDDNGYKAVSLSMDIRNPAVNFYKQNGFTFLNEMDQSYTMIKYFDNL